MLKSFKTVIGFCDSFGWTELNKKKSFGNSFDFT